MSQAKILPEQIVANVFAPHDGKVVKHNMETVEKLIRDYANEVAVTAIILSDNYMKALYKASGEGYMFCIDELQSWAKEFVDKFAHVEEWEEFIYSDKNPYPKAMCWDDVVIMFGEEKYQHFIK